MVVCVTSVPYKKLCYMFLFQVFIISSLIFCVQRMWYNKQDDLCRILKKNVPREMRKVVILLWTLPFRDSFNLNQCAELFGITGCIYTSDRTFYRNADAVIFHHSDLMYTPYDLPRQPRPVNQRWIWFNLEPPTKIINLHTVDKLMNLSMTYRPDSDIFTPYGCTLFTEKPQNFSIPTKSRLVAWATSNWNKKIRRVRYYEELKKHLHIDVFGWGNMHLGRDEQALVLSKYKFYLAFENSESQDYITEKLWNNALLSWAVPVVLGPTRENYERFLPGEAFIHVDDFPSAKELAEYLLALDKDDERYRKYFTWRSHYEVVPQINWATHYCKACYYLRKPPTYRTVPSVVKWFT
ncbi:3-galactosyl-N-acetylglucosaminide 4-alpha-L-fucosyltransferase FUT3-like [Ambystoma mexicanum]|uniref:3-galactosyl-N-acetylglucosaminide 4-alpha-L-fucosyltransferase FUT3-like n=1 Tax=Ambystoma mexicanum TaxID=8296 RepID=UPI0037E8FF84